MTAQSWAFGGVPFTWLRQEANGHAAQATWNQAPLLAERQLLGTGEAELASNGYEPWRIAGPLLVEAPSAAAFRALNGTKATLTDGTTSWPAVLVVNLLDLSGGGASGTATFTRVRQ